MCLRTIILTVNDNLFLTMQIFYLYFNGERRDEELKKVDWLCLFNEYLN